MQLEIDTGDAQPKKQCPRRMLFAIREDVCRLDQDAGRRDD